MTAVSFITAVSPMTTLLYNDAQCYKKKWPCDCCQILLAPHVWGSTGVLALILIVHKKHIKQ